MQLCKFFMRARVRLLVLGTLGLNKEEHDEQNPDRRGGGGGVFVRMLGSLRRFALGGPSSLFFASPPPS